MDHAKDTAAPGREDTNPLTQPLAGKRCLVLDDDLLIALDIEQILQGAGASEVTCVATLADALAAVRDEPPFAVAVIDIDLGAEDSMMIAAALHERGVPFVFLTGLNDDDPRARKYPQAPVVDKPYQVDQLLAALDRAINKS